MSNKRTVQILWLSLLFCSIQNLIIAQQAIRSQKAIPIVGNKKVLFMRAANFGTGLTYTATEANTRTLQAAHRAHVTRNSNGKAYVEDYVITPVFDIPTAPNPAGFIGINQLLNAAATAAGYNLANYDFFVYCSQSEFGAGGLGAHDNSTGKGNLYISVSGNFYHPGSVHEFYHAFGLGHAEYIEGGAYVYPGVSTYGGLDPYHHIGSDYDATPATWLSQDLAAYTKYYLGWLDATNVTVIDKPTTGTGTTHRIYRHNNLTALSATRKVSLQIGDKFWVSYEPTTTNPLIRKTGVLVHYLPPESPSVTRLLDGTPDSRPGTTKEQQYDDLFDAALTVGDNITFDGISLEVVATGGTGENAWVDVRVYNCALVPGNDTDGDGVCNVDDRCVGDNRIDSDLDTKPDACDTCPNDPDNDANTNGICDNIECFSTAVESFEYATSTAVPSAAGGTGLAGSWQKMNADNGVLEIANGSLTYNGLQTKGNSLRVAPTSTANNVQLRREMTGSFKKGYAIWVSFLMKVNNNSEGAVFIRPNNDHSLAFGKKVGPAREIGLNNNGTGINVVTGQTYLLVIRYKIAETNDTAHLWVNPNLQNFPSLAAANATKVAPYTQGTINKFEIYLDGRAGDYQIDEFRVGCSPPVYNASFVLPVELLNFTAAPLSKNVEVKWQTASEKNASHFEVERSFDGKNFSKIGQIKAKGSSSTLQNYHFIDANPQGLNYYRLQQVDVDSTTQQSHIVTVSMEKQQKLEVYPSPASDKIVVVASNASDYSIHDILGHEILRGGISEHSTEINVANLPSGMYWVRSQNAVAKFVKQ